MENTMSQDLTLKAFFFNAKTDYLPYYKNFTITLPDDAVAKDILTEIKSQNETFTFPALNLVFKINNLVVEEETRVAEIVMKLGSELKIDPVNSYRSNNGLIINDDDFMKSFELLAPYASTEDKEYYKTLYALHYASETENFDREYIGDAILILAHKMITTGNEHKEEILKAITSVHSGLMDCEYENNLFNAQDHSKTIASLKAMVNDDSNEHPSLIDMIKARFDKVNISQKKPIQSKRESIIIANLVDKHIAHYAGSASHDEMHALIQKSGLKGIHFPRSNKLSGQSIFKENRTLALTKAGTTLLDAFDAGAEVLVIEDKASYDMFTQYFSEIEKVIGRKMIGLELISSEDFTTQMSILSA